MFTLLEEFPTYFSKYFLQEWLLQKDLLRLISAYFVARDSHIQEKILIYILTALFLKHRTPADLQFHRDLLARRLGRVLFKIALSDDGFERALKQSLCSMSTDVFYRYNMLRIWMLCQSGEVLQDSTRIQKKEALTVAASAPTLQSDDAPSHLNTLKLLALTLENSEIQISEKMQQQLESVVALCNAEDDDLSYAAFEVVRAFIFQLKTKEAAERFINPRLLMLQHENDEVRLVALNIIAIFISSINTLANAQRFIHSVFSMLNDDDKACVAAALVAITAYIATANASDVAPFVGSILTKLNDDDPDVCAEALRAVTAFICKMNTLEEAQPFIEHLLGVSNHNRNVRLALQEGITACIDRFEATTQWFINLILGGIHDTERDIRVAALDALTACVCRLEISEIQRLVDPLLALLRDKHSPSVNEALEAINILMSRVGEGNLAEITVVLTQYINGYLHRRVAQKALSRMLVCYPTYTHRFDTENASEEMLMLINMQDMQQMINLPKNGVILPQRSLMAEVGQLLWVGHRKREAQTNQSLDLNLSARIEPI